MSRILIVYSTTDGQTKKIAGAIGMAFGRLGHTYDIFDCKTIAPEVTPRDYDIVIAGASVRYSKFQRSIRKWVKRNALMLNEIPSYFFSVCLGKLQKEWEVQSQERKIVKDFLDGTGWRPHGWKIIAGAIPYTKYNFWVRWMMKRIAEKAGGDTDTSRDYEYTDWNEVAQFARSIASETEKARSA